MLERLKRVFRPSEKALFEELSSLTNLCEKALGILHTVFASEEGPRNVEEVASKLLELEQEGDLIVKRLENEIAMGAMTTPLISEFSALVNNIDLALDRAMLASRELARYKRYGPSDTPLNKDVYRKVALMLERAMKASNLMKSFLSNGGEDLSIPHKIEELEEDGDKDKEVLLDTIYSQADELAPLTLHHLIRIVISADEILDSLEDASDMAVAVIASLKS